MQNNLLRVIPWGAGLAITSETLSISACVRPSPKSSFDAQLIRKAEREANFNGSSHCWSGFSSRLICDNGYDARCFGAFSLSVEIRPSAAGGTCVS